MFDGIISKVEEIRKFQQHIKKMKVTREAKPTLLFTFYFTINTSFSLLFKFFSLNLHQNHVQIFAFVFVSAFYIAAVAITWRNPSPHLLKDEISKSSKLEASTIQFLDHDQETVENIMNCSNDRQFVSHQLLNFECYNSEFDDDGECQTCSCDWLCGYEGDDEDDGEYEDGDFNNKIEDFIAGKKKEWREEMIRERLLCIE